MGQATNPRAAPSRPQLSTLRITGWVLLRRLPLTAGLFSLVLLAGVLTGTVLRESFPRLMRWSGWDLPALREGRLYVLWTGLPFSSLPGPRPTMLAILLLGVGTLEYRRGSRATAICFLVLGPLVSVLAVLLLWPLDALGTSWVRPFLYVPDMGSSSASLLCWGAMVGGTKGTGRFVLLSATLGVLLLPLVLSPGVYGFDHLVAFPLGLLVGAPLTDQLTRWRWGNQVRG